MVYLFSSPEFAQFWFFSGTHVSIATSHCHSVCFCVALCVVLALNSWAMQDEACISTAKFAHLPFFLEAVLKLYFGFILTGGEMKRNKNENTET